MQNLSRQIDSLENDNDQKDNLINEANKVIEEITDEKHDIKAKFKHLIQIYVDQVEKESSYKGDESSLSIMTCFEKIQGALDRPMSVAPSAAVVS